MEGRENRALLGKGVNSGGKSACFEFIPTGCSVSQRATVLKRSVDKKILPTAIFWKSEKRLIIRSIPFSTDQCIPPHHPPTPQSTELPVLLPLLGFEENLNRTYNTYSSVN